MTIASMSEHYTSNEAEVTLRLFKVVHEDQLLIQRSAAQNLGVALSLVISYSKRCVKKGLIKVKQAPSSRYAYYLTPKGFAEKTKLTASYLL
jgi:predicted transcriptional regulator